LEIHLTSLLEENSKENIVQTIKRNELSTNQNSVNNQELINEKVITENLKKQNGSQPFNNKELIDEKVISDNVKKQSESQPFNNRELINEQNINTNSQNDNQNDELKEKWELILSKLELPSTRMLLSQQAELTSINSNEVSIALSPNWENMIKSRKVIIETAIKKVFGDQTKLIFSNKKINIPNSTKSQKEMIKNPDENQARKSKDFQTSNTPLKNTEKVSYDNSPKDLANFFNGEIIDLNE